jgi:hypothetical protein
VFVDLFLKLRRIFSIALLLRRSVVLFETDVIKKEKDKPSIFLWTNAEMVFRAFRLPLRNNER